MARRKLHTHPKSLTQGAWALGFLTHSPRHYFMYICVRDSARSMREMVPYYVWQSYNHRTSPKENIIRTTKRYARLDRSAENSLREVKWACPLPLPHGIMSVMARRACLHPKSCKQEIEASSSFWSKHSLDAPIYLKVCQYL